MRVAMCFVMSMAAASAAEVPRLGLSAEPGDIRFAFAEAAVAEGGLLSVHTEEATLEDIFIDLAGKGLSA